MNKTKKKIILAAIELFNESGLVNVLNQEIATKAGISLSNFNYHFSTKKKLVYAVCEYMRISLNKIISENSMLAGEGVGLEVSKLFFEFQEDFRFFYFDTQNILHTYPDMGEAMKKEIEIAIRIVKNIHYMSIGRGYMKPEPAEKPGLYNSLAEQVWMTNHFWSAQLRIRGFEGDAVQEGLKFIFGIVYPYLTESGIKMYEDFIEKSRLEGET